MWNSIYYIRRNYYYENIKQKAKKLSKYELSWYIDRIIPHIEKMIEAKKGNIDNNYFKDIIQNNEASDWVAGCPMHMK